jgi:hypothetical protein
VGTDEDTPHNPTKMFPMLAAPLARRGIQLTYGRTPADAIDPARLKYYDAVMLYGDGLSLTAAQQQALTAFVEAGHGLIALHAVGDLPLVGANSPPRSSSPSTRSYKGCNQSRRGKNRSRKSRQAIGPSSWSA